MIVRLAGEQDVPGLLDLARQVEPWFGPMAGDPDFRAALGRHIRRGTAVVAVAAGQAGVLGGLLFSARPPAYHVRWLVVSAPARGRGAGRALMAEAMRRYMSGPGVVEVVTFGAGHPSATASGARAFYERLGFTPAEAAAPGPEGGSRQVYRKTVP